MQFMSPPILDGIPTKVYSSSTNNPDIGALVTTELGLVDPLGVGDTFYDPVVLRIIVESGVVIGSSVSSTATPAVDVNAFDSGSTFILVNLGKIQGRGGNGGTSYSNTVSNAASGGGGGGAGTEGGLGAEGADYAPTMAATKGADGTTSAGGSGGIADTGPAQRNQNNGLDGGSGGDAIQFNSARFIIANSGQIWGGGGGGGGGGLTGASAIQDGGDGGDPGSDGGDAEPQPGHPDGVQFRGGNGGSAGYAIRHSGTLTWVRGSSSPNVEGTVGS